MITSLSKDLNILFLNIDKNNQNEKTENKGDKGDKGDKKDEETKSKQLHNYYKLSSFQLSKTNIKEKDKIIELKNKITFLINYVKFNYAKDDISLVKKITEKLSAAKKEKKKSFKDTEEISIKNNKCTIF